MTDILSPATTRRNQPVYRECILNPAFSSNYRGDNGEMLSNSCRPQDRAIVSANVMMSNAPHAPYGVIRWAARVAKELVPESGSISRDLESS
jgi:hypothetical protein